MAMRALALRTMDMAIRHLRDNAAAWANFLRAPPENLPSKLMAVGAFTCGLAAFAAASPPADGGQLVTRHSVWLGAAVLAFIGSLCAIWGAFWWPPPPLAAVQLGTSSSVPPWCPFSSQLPSAAPTTPSSSSKSSSTLYRLEEPAIARMYPRYGDLLLSSHSHTIYHARSRD